MGEPTSDETPWALIQRLRAENQPEEHILERLKARGLSEADAELLGVRRTPLATAPAPRPPHESKASRESCSAFLPD